MLEDAPTVIGEAKHSDDDRIPAALTDIGCERDINEDRYAVVNAAAGRAWIVCDGMGGEVGGELAAQLAIDAIRRGLESRDFNNLDEAVQCAVGEANRIIVLRRQNPAFSAMGTTVTMAMVRDDELVVGSIGDSRAYLVKGGRVQQITEDHTLVQEMVRKGEISEEEALSHPQAHVLTKCLGAAPALSADIFHFWLWPQQSGAANSLTEKLLMCSDGLYSLVSDNEIAGIVSRYSPQESCVKLVELAKERGGYDNITVSILPLQGELRKDGPPPGRKVKSVVPPARAMNKQLPVDYPWGRQIAKTVLLFAAGGLVGLLLFVMQM